MMKPSFKTLEDLAAFDKHGIGIILLDDSVIGQMILRGVDHSKNVRTPA